MNDIEPINNTAGAAVKVWHDNNATHVVAFSEK
jgi:hypothetical protein